MEESKKEGLIFAVDVGALMLYAGAEVYRVNDTIIHMLKALEIDNVEVYVLSNGIFASTNEQSIVRNVTLGPIHLGKVSAINQLSRDLSAHRQRLYSHTSKWNWGRSLCIYIWRKYLRCTFWLYKWHSFRSALSCKRHA